MKTRSDLKILYLLFSISGIAALMYQVIWQRLLTYFTGSDISSISLIVCAYMAGLGFGSLAGGYIADRVGQRSRIFLFGMAELLIGVFALCSKFLFYDYLYGVAIHSHYDGFIVFVILFSVLLVPTFLMGASLPLLSKNYSNSIDDGVSLIGRLYFVNTLGAAAGALLPVFLVSHIGFVGALIFASMLNLFCFLASWYLIFTRDWKGDDRCVNERYDDNKIMNPSVWFWFVVSSITGFIGVSLEIVWFRMISAINKPLYFTFSLQLSVFILGLAIGSILKRHIPAAYRNKSILFFFVQSLIAFYIVVSISLFFYAVHNAPSFAPIYRYLGSYEPDTLPSRLFILYGAVLPYFVFIPTVLMGFSFILLQSILQDNVSTMGRKLGLAQFMNIVGSGLGAIVTTYLFINYFGTAITFKILIATIILLSLSALLMMKKRWDVPLSKFIVPVLAAFLLFTFFPSNNIFWSTLHGVGVDDLIYREDASGIAAIQIDGKESEHVMFSNGLGQSKMNYSVIDHHVMFGLLPSLLHPNPVKVAIIGLGSGSTLFGISGRIETKSITCFEIVNPQREILQVYSDSFPTVALNKILSDHRIAFISNDARYSLSTSIEKYDIIEADALRKNSAYSGNLYSKEYFQLLKSKLKPGGYAVTWVPSERTLHTVKSVFKHCHVYGMILIASDYPILQVDDAIDRFDDSFVQSFQTRTGINPLSVISDARQSLTILPASYSDAEINTDLFPRDEFEVLEKWD